MLKRIREDNHRAVAPIIATLLMVAIAVVGGILIFVFTQGFFADEQVVGPTVDNIRINGYDATDGALTSLDGVTTVSCASAGSAGTLATNDCILIYIENLGDKATSIQNVRIFGETFTLSDATTTLNCGDTNGEFQILDGTASGAILGIIDPNTEANVCLKYDGGSGAVKAGRTIPIQIETANGQSSQINVQNGGKRG